MGHRFEIYVPEDIASDVIAISDSFNLEAKIVGHCSALSGKKLTVRSEMGEFEY